MPTGDGSTRSVPFSEVLARYAPDYLATFGHAMPARQREVLARILKCRTPALGGSLYVCPRCGDRHYACHSCNDRHCPRCGRTEADRWLAARQQRLLLPVPFFLVTFTVPEGLRPWFRSHPRTAYNLMFALTAQTLQDLAANPKRLGGSLGLLGVLHTWSRTLVYHPHLHYLVPGGALTPDQRQWKPSLKKFLLPVKPLGQRFRALFKKALARHHPQALAQLPPKVWKQNWVVHTQPVGSGHHALAYLSRYLFKTATGDRPLIERSDGKILWPYRQSRTGQLRHLPLAPFELTRRFLQHVLPRGYTRVRCFGWFHPAARIRLNRVRALLKQQPVLTPAQREAWQGPEPWEPPETHSTPSSPTPDARPLCRRCQLPMECRTTWRPGQKPPQPWQRGPP